MKVVASLIDPHIAMCQLDRLPGKDAVWGSGKPPDPATSDGAPYRFLNIGNEQPVYSLRYIEVLEQCLGRKAQMEMLPLQAADVPDTEAAGGVSAEGFGGRGVVNFVEWYRNYYGAQH